MDKTSTQEFELSESVIKNAFKFDFFPQPSTSSLEFIKNFARNFRVIKNVDSSLQGFILN